MSRSCRTCQHLKRSEIDRRLAAGEPSAQVARDYELNASSLHRHRANCLKLGSSNAIMKDAARGSAAIALLPSKEALSDAYFELRILVGVGKRRPVMDSYKGDGRCRAQLDRPGRLGKSKTSTQ